MKIIFLILIRIYQWTISPVLGPICRFTPSCSNYTMQAIQKYGVWHGSWLGIKRICRCNGRHLGGKDDVP
ncbi:MAG: membrane protein insertion efficiency factor YidD [Parachlamydiaceae bacterium]|nr:MAG: membrane protein insertion efficiency factor YidD [Parachlamydiaceae bacterium]